MMRAWSDVAAELEASDRSRHGRRWHLVQMCAGPGRKDRSAITWLARRGYEPYYPMLRTLRRPPQRHLSHKQRQSKIPVVRQVLTAMFPHYCFVRFDRYHDHWRDVFGLFGVRGLVCEHNLPVPIADDLIERLRACEVDGAIPGETPATEIFRLGEVVEVVDGPFRRMRGHIEKINGHTIDGIDSGVRITILVEGFGRSTSVELDGAQIEAVATPSHGQPR